MGLDWILHPALQCSLESAGLLLCLYLFLSLKREARQAGLRSRSSQQAAESVVEELRRAIEELRSEVRRVDGEASRLVEPLPAASGLNISKRTQALRMRRRGEPPEIIAAALQLPQREVELLLEVEKISSEKS